MSELRTIVLAARGLRRQGEPFALATLVHVEGSSYRLPGARMVMTPDRWVAGSVSGGCLEGDLVRKAWWRTASGEPALVTYDSSSDEDVGWGFGLGCNGVATILVERVTEAHDPLAHVERMVASILDGGERELRGALVTVFRSGRADVPVGTRLALGADGALASTPLCAEIRERLGDLARGALAQAGPGGVVREAADFSVLVEALAPAPHLFVVGSGHDALPVVQMAKAVGWCVTVVDRKARFAARERFTAADRVVGGDPEALRREVDRCERPLAVVMSHDYEGDRDALAALLRTRATYLGVLGPRRRTDRMLAEIAAGGALSTADPGRLHAPVGLAIGAETPQEIALSIVAEAQAVLARTDATPLRDRVTPIHARAEVPAAGARAARSPRCVCAVLAAGASRRLGRPKQLVTFRGRPLVRHVAEQACAAGCERVAVVVGAHASAVCEGLAGLPLDLLDNDAWEEGVASSIRVATAWAAELGAGALAFVLADQPGLTAAHLRRLADAQRAGARRVGSAYAGTIGVPALFDASDFERLLALTGDRGAATLLHEREAHGGPDRARVVAIPWPEGAVDIDTPRDLERLALLDGAG